MSLQVVHLGYQINTHWLWRGLNFSLEAGQVLCIQGVSGVGKSVLLKCICGLLEPTEGTIYFQQRVLSGWSLPEYRVRVMYLNQHPAFIDGSVESNLRHVFQFKTHREKQYQGEWVQQALTRFGKKQAFLRQNVADLSGGERQIVSFLRAIQLQPDVLLLDEPTASLDAGSTATLAQMVTEWLTIKRACIFASHDYRLQENIPIHSTLEI